MLTNTGALQVNVCQVARIFLAQVIKRRTSKGLRRPHCLACSLMESLDAPIPLRELGVG